MLTDTLIAIDTDNAVIRFYTLTGQALADSLAESGREAQYLAERARYLAPPRLALRRLVAYLAIRWGNAWLDASTDILDGYLPPFWQTMAHHELVTYLDLQGITPEHCILA